MPKVLIVDDDDATREILRERLEDSYEIADTGRPEEALALALNFKPDCVLLDLMMPTLTGLELFQTLKSLSHTRAIPIFVITGEPAANYKELCIGLGMKEYFEKPLNIEQLKASLVATLKIKPSERRRKARIHLRLNMKLRGVDANGTKFESLTVTENVSANGFYCTLGTRLRMDDSVDAFLLMGHERFVGRARVVRTVSQTPPVEYYGFEFTEKSADWLLG